MNALRILALLALSGCCRPGLSSQVPVALRAQEAQNWCWAASGQMVMETLHHGTNQCSQVNARLGVSDCACNGCNGGSVSAECDATGWPQFDRYGFTARHTTNEALTWDQLRSQVSNGPSCKNRPFAFTWRWEGGGWYRRVSKGVDWVDGERFVSVVDPWAPCAGDELIVSYDYYVAEPGDHSHWDDYYDVEYVGP